MLSSWTRFSVAGLIAVAAAVVSGCSTTSEEGAAVTAGSIDSTKAELQKTVDQIDVAVGALNYLARNPQANLRPQYDKFAAAVADLESQAALTKTRADEMRANGVAYFDSWEEKPDAAADPELKASYDAIIAGGLATRDAFDPFLDTLKDISGLLKMDLSAAGIDNIQGLVDKANPEAQALKKRAQAMMVELEKVAALLVPKEDA